MFRAHKRNAPALFSEIRREITTKKRNGDCFRFVSIESDGIWLLLTVLHQAFCSFKSMQYLSQMNFTAHGGSSLALGDTPIPCNIVWSLISHLWNVEVDTPAANANSNLYIALYVIISHFCMLNTKKEEISIISSQFISNTQAVAWDKGFLRKAYNYRIFRRIPVLHLY